MVALARPGSTGGVVRRGAGVSLVDCHAVGGEPVTSRRSATPKFRLVDLATDGHARGHVVCAGGSLRDARCRGGGG